MDAPANDSLFRSLFESAGDAILLLDSDTVVACNQKTLDIFGCPRDRIIGKRPTDFSPTKQPDGKVSEDEFERRIALALNGQVQRFSWKHLRCDGAPFDAEVTLNRVDVSGQGRLQAIIRDVTERRRLEKERERLTAIIESTPDYVGIAMPDGTSIYLNDSFGRIMPAAARVQTKAGHTISISAFQPPDAAKQLMEVAVPFAVRHGFWQGESALMDSRGKEFPVLQTLIAHIDPTGTLESFSVIMRDISSIKETERHTLQEHALFRTAQRAGHIGIWYSDPDTQGKVVWTDETYRIFGLTPETFDGRVETFFKSIHPEDLLMVQKASAQALDPAVRAPYNVEHRIIRPDGQVRWVHQEGEVIWGVESKPGQFIGIIIDTTDAHRSRSTAEHAAQLEQLNKAMIGRELRMIELKEENERLKAELTKPAPKT